MYLKWISWFSDVSNGLFQVWQLGSSSPNFTLEGHEKGVNCIDYYSGGDKPYLISGADDRQVKIWDYQVKKPLFYENIKVSHKTIIIQLMNLKNE